MILAPEGRLASASVVAAGLLACFTVGVFAVRSTTEGLILIGALGCLVVYLTGPHRMVWIALFLAFASLPAALYVGKVIGPVSIYLHQAAVVLAIVFLMSRAGLHFSRFVLPLVFALAVTFFAAAGTMAGHDPVDVAREASFLYETVAGCVLAVVIIRTGIVSQAVRVMALVLWFSAGMILASSVTGLKLAGRAESLRSETGSEAIRILTATQAPALVVLTALVAASIVGRARLSTWLMLGPPALAISLLSFSRHMLIAVAVGAGVAFLTSIGWAAMRRSATLVAAGVVTLAVGVPLSLFLLHGAGPGEWLAEQVQAFSHRVLGGVSASALSVDSSTIARLHETVSLRTAIEDSPLLGHGLGFAYQLPFGEAGSFTATLGTTYAHNFYLWWLAKAGVVGMIAFALFALPPVLSALRTATVPAKISASVLLALLTICVVNPLPLEPASSLVLGMAVGAAMAFGRPGRTSPPATSTPSPVAHTSG
ncbi:O-antigen ligase family protein [Mycobacterium deserti]|uniref:O-antigen ligase family protein n=1 Tax=Mycobacterium deserti TaxID=2978347 RepID=A0ABT2MD20_9MYCO|nr:O-antigen ligase family protein [Mycobacterium deserti]MCT7660163.1 O-antigen ligase family protein [Mycobacterium deserti]